MVTPCPKTKFFLKGRKIKIMHWKKNLREVTGLLPRLPHNVIESSPKLQYYIPLFSDQMRFTSTFPKHRFKNVMRERNCLLWSSQTNTNSWMTEKSAFENAAGIAQCFAGWLVINSFLRHIDLYHSSASSTSSTHLKILLVRPPGMTKWLSPLFFMEDSISYKSIPKNAHI